MLNKTTKNIKVYAQMIFLLFQKMKKIEKLMSHHLIHNHILNQVKKILFIQNLHLINKIFNNKNINNKKKRCNIVIMKVIVNQTKVKIKTINKIIIIIKKQRTRKSINFIIIIQIQKYSMSISIKLNKISSIMKKMTNMVFIREKAKIQKKNNLITIIIVTIQ